MIIFGKNTVREAINKKRFIKELIISQEKVLNEFPKNSLSKETKITLMPLKEMNQKYNGNHQGVVAIIDEYKYLSLNALIDKNKQKENVSLIMLDGLEDPHNLGAILRTADATGMNGIIIPKNRSVSLNQTVAKVSTGAIEYVDVVQVTNLVSTLKELKEHGYWVIGLEMEGSVDYKEQDYTGKKVIVIGSEGKGISRLVKTECDFMVNIPMIGHVNSLNASVSASIIFYEILRQRG